MRSPSRKKSPRPSVLPNFRSDQGWIVIWTTTPWTIPGNQALNAHPEHVYNLIATERGLLILAADLQDACLARYGLAGTVLASCKGKALELIAFHHPFYERLAPVYLGEYVTLDTGTGIVHSAPAYGVEDFDSCRRYGMKDEQILTPVMADGKYVSSLPFFGGMMIWKANPEVVKKIEEVGALFHCEDYAHSYMHCWRHKTPIIYRASTQWFAAMDEPPGYKGVKPAESLRTTALRGVDNTRFYPDWGQARLRGMIANRPDWTLSRQRQWGVPMPFFIHRETAELHPRTLELLEQVAKRVEQGGIEAWQTLDPKELLGAEAEHYVKIKDTLDVWFDSGSTHQTVMGGPAGQATGAGSHGAQLQFPADLYLEGSDQHRGWFHSSLLVSCMLNGVPPYKSLLTHGFFVDGQGRKMSKSLGNTLEPQKIAGSLGAEILRLWVAATDYSGELSISDEILKRVVESYRRIRNTLRFLLANTADFDPKAHALPVEDWLEIDRYALALAQSLQQEMTRDYGNYDFHFVVQKLQGFCSEDMGGFYLDILKDRLYTAGRDSKARRSAQNALYQILQRLVRLMAPILSFTAEEIWALAAGGKDRTRTSACSPIPGTSFRRRAIRGNCWIAGQASAACVPMCKNSWRKRVSPEKSAPRCRPKSRSAQAVASWNCCNRWTDDLRFVLITSSAMLTPVAAAADEAVIVSASAHAKCERCWHYRADVIKDGVGADAAHPGLCGRCVSNLYGAGEARTHA